MNKALLKVVALSIKYSFNNVTITAFISKKGGFERSIINYFQILKALRLHCSNNELICRLETS